MKDAENERAALAALTYDEWLAYYQAQPGGWLVTAAPADVLRIAYEQRIVTFDEMEQER